MNKTTNQAETVSLTKAAEMLGVSRSTASRLYRRGLIRGRKKTLAKNSALRIYTDSIQKYLALLNRQPSPE